MGVKKFFKMKPPEEESDAVNRDNLLTLGFPTKSDSTRKPRSKFEAFNAYSKEKRHVSEPLRPVEAKHYDTKASYEPPAQANNNPYAGLQYEAGRFSTSNPSTPTTRDYGGSSGSTFKSDSLYPDTPLTTQTAWTPPITPIAKQHTKSFSDGNHDYYNSASMNNNTLLNPYNARRSSTRSSIHSNPTSRKVSDAFREDSTSMHSSSLSRKTSTREEYTSDSARTSLFHTRSPPPPASEKLFEANYEVQDEEEEEEDLNAYPQYEPSVNLNEEPEHDTDNYSSYQNISRAYDFERQRQIQLQREQEEEDEEVDRIKQDIKFTKQQSLASTRNTLRMAGEAEASGQNTLGMLGSQSEKLYNVERDLLLAKTQNVIATDKVKEMAKLDRSFLLVHVSNPFNSKVRAKRQEDKVRSQREEDKLIQEKLRSQQYRTEVNISSGIQRAERNDNSNFGLNGKYDAAQRLDAAAKYQFEQDEEDDEIELEISKNLDAIENSTRNLNQMAKAISSEVGTQQRRWHKVEQETDDLEMQIHLNNHRLHGVMK